MRSSLSTKLQRVCHGIASIRPQARARREREGASVNPGSALLASAGGDRVSVVLGLEPAWPAAHAFGPALTVQGAPGDNLALHHAVAAAARGDVIVLAVGGETATAHCGDIVALAARERGVAGIVVDGAVRDRAQLESVGVPVFHIGTSPRGPGKAGPGALRTPITMNGVTINPGDVVCADADGIAIVAPADADDVLAAARAIEEREREIVAALERGETTVTIFGLNELE
jgi:4-hydroxy-4-methyl-2-oxoglutarate aldolase